MRLASRLRSLEVTAERTRPRPPTCLYFPKDRLRCLAGADSATLGTLIDLHRMKRRLPKEKFEAHPDRARLLAFVAGRMEKMEKAGWPYGGLPDQKEVMAAYVQLEPA